MSAAALPRAGSGAGSLHRFGLVRQTLRRIPSFDGEPSLQHLLDVAREDCVTVVLPGGYSPAVQRVAVSFQLASVWLSPDMVATSAWCPRELLGDQDRFRVFVHESRIEMAAELLRLPSQIVEAVVHRVVP